MSMGRWSKTFPIAICHNFNKLISQPLKNHYKPLLTIMKIINLNTTQDYLKPLLTYVRIISFNIIQEQFQTVAHSRKNNKF